MRLRHGGEDANVSGDSVCLCGHERSGHGVLSRQCYSGEGDGGCPCSRFELPLSANIGLRKAVQAAIFKAMPMSGIDDLTSGPAEAALAAVDEHLRATGRRAS